MLTNALNWRSLDLNLLVVFVVVAEELSVTRAATRLNMTQPAISHALGRLRNSLHDELFIRTPDGMNATPYARRLVGPVQAALHDLGVALEKATTFHPASSDSSFKVAANNQAAIILVARIAREVHALAPRMRLEFVPSGTIDLVDQLDKGALDLALSGQQAAGERFRDRQLYDEGFVALMQRGHPAAPHEDMTPESLARYPHMALSSTGEDTSFVDHELGRRGLAREVVLRAPLHSAASVLSRSQAIAVVSERVARHFTTVAALQVVRLPFGSPRMNTTMLWHRRLDDVPAHRWLRELIAGVAGTL